MSCRNCGIDRIQKGIEPDCATCPIAEIAPVPGAEELVFAFLRGMELRNLSPHVTDIEKLAWDSAGVLDDIHAFYGMQLGYARAVYTLRQREQAKQNGRNLARGRRGR